MSSPLAVYNDIEKQYNITPEKRLHPRQKVAFVDEQINQIKIIIHRDICDLVPMKLAYEKAKDPDVKASYNSKITNFEQEIRKKSEALDNFLELKKDFDTEVAEAGEE